MRKYFLFIMTLILVCLLTGCRASLESKVSQSRQQADEIGVVLRRVDSLSSTISERHNVRIEFYPPTYNTESLVRPCTGSPFAAAPPTTLPADSTHVGIPQYGGWSGFGGMGSVKSIEITTEKTEDRSSITAADSVVQQKAQSEETRQRERASEARHDNGTVIGLAIVAAAAIIVIIRILIKIYLKK